MDDAPLPPSPDDLAALHHPVRRRLLEFLNLHGPATVGTVAAGLGQQVGSVSHHMKTLERAGFVAPAPELANDRRESWWRSVPRSVSWSITDFKDSPVDLLLATAAQQANLQHHADKVSGWFADREEYDDAWVDASFSTDIWATVTPEELADLADQVNRLLRRWGAACEAAAADEDEDQRARRTPVFVFAHGNPARP